MKFPIILGLFSMVVGKSVRAKETMECGWMVNYLSAMARDVGGMEGG